MPTITMYTTAYCPYCNMAKALLKQKGIHHIEEIRIDGDPALRSAMMARTGRPPCRRFTSAAPMWAALTI